MRVTPRWEGHDSGLSRNFNKLIGSWRSWGIGRIILRSATQLKLMTMNNKLLFINEYGIYPELVKRLQETQYSVTVEHLMRNAIKFIKKQNPSVVVAEFYHEPQFRDRVSNLESMLAQIEGRHAETRTLVFYDPKHQKYLDKLLAVFSVDAVLMQPITPQILVEAIDAFAATE